MKNKNSVVVSWQKEILKKEKQSLEVRIFDYPNQELKVWLDPEKVKDKNVVLKVNFYPQVNRNLFLTFLLLDALKRVGVKKISLWSPWFPYSPQNEVFLAGEPLSMELVIHLLETAGADEFIIYDVHHVESLAFFTKPVVHLSYLSSFSRKLKAEVDKDWLIVSPDQGGRERSQYLANKLAIGQGWFVKKRHRQTGKITFAGYVGNKVLGKKIILIDDFSASGGTLLRTAKKLKEMGAVYVVACLSHLLMTKRKFKQILKNPVIDKWLIGTK